MEKIEIVPLGHSDMGLEWYRNFEDSVSAYAFTGHINMKYSSIPYFILNLAKTVDNLDFLGKKSKKQILESNYVSFADSDYKEIEDVVERDTRFIESFWKGRYTVDGKEKIMDGESLKIGRFNYELDPLIEKLKEVNLNPDDFDFVGVVKGSLEHPRHINMLGFEGETYISQVWRSGINIVKANEEKTKRLIKDIDKHYGSVVSGALKGLIKNRE